MFEELLLFCFVLFFCSDFSLKQPEVLTVYRLLFLIPVLQGNNLERTKTGSSFQEVSSSTILEFSSGSSVHPFLKYYFLFCFQNNTMLGLGTNSLLLFFISLRCFWVITCHFSSCYAKQKRHVRGKGASSIRI